MDVEALRKALGIQIQDNVIILLRVLIWTLPFNGCAASGKLLTPRSSRFLICKIGDMMSAHCVVVS